MFTLNAQRARPTATMMVSVSGAATTAAPARPMAAGPPPPGPPPAGGAGAPPAYAPAPNAHRRSLRDDYSARRTMVGPLSRPEGLHATAWIEGKPHSVAIRCNDEVSDLMLYPINAKASKKGPQPIAADAQPMAIVPGGAYSAVRIGLPIKDGKSVKQGGLFSKGPKADRTVCLDSTAGNSIVQLEAASVAEATEMMAALEGLSSVLTKLAQEQ